VVLCVCGQVLSINHFPVVFAVNLSLFVRHCEGQRKNTAPAISKGLLGNIGETLAKQENGR